MMKGIVDAIKCIVAAVRSAAFVVLMKQTEIPEKGLVQAIII
jgi:hypothetical protein